jgi:hypothetical protein
MTLKPSKSCCMENRGIVGLLNAVPSLEILERILQRVSQSFNSDYLIRRNAALPVLPLMCQELLDGNRAGIGYKATFSAGKIRGAIRTSIRFRGAPSGAIRPLKVHASGMRDR